MQWWCWEQWAGLWQFLIVSTIVISVMMIEWWRWYDGDRCQWATFDNIQRAHQAVGEQPAGSRCSCRRWRSCWCNLIKMIKKESKKKEEKMQPRRLLVFLRCHWARADSPTWPMVDHYFHLASQLSGIDSRWQLVYWRGQYYKTHPVRKASQIGWASNT